MLGEFFSDNRKVGIGLTLFGTGFLMLGVLFFFDRAFLALGNFLFLGGITMLIGGTKTIKFFARKSKAKGSACFLGGVIMVLMGWTFFGMIVELFGILNLFGDFFPVVINVLKRLPIIGPIMRLPPVSAVLNRFMGQVLPQFSKSDA